MEQAREVFEQIEEKLHPKTRKFLKSKIKIGAKKISVVLLIAILLGCLFIYLFIFKDLPNPSGLRNYRVIPVSTQIFDRHGKLLYDVYKEQNRTPIKLGQLPPYVKQATIAIEDKDFYKHGGVSIFGGILRALKDTFLLHKGVQGGSTITQQLVKGALLTPERTIQRKLREIVLAIWTEQILSKDDILELYLNQVPYGGSAYGIEQAAQTYFNKSAKELTIAEGAFLAGLPQAPSRYSPYVNMDLATRRRNQVLNQMEEQGYITSKEREAAKNEKIIVLPFKTKIKAPHFVFYVKSALEKQYGVQTVEEGGLKVHTTVELDTQEKAEEILNDELDKIKRLRVTNGAVLVTRPPTGEILAMVGSSDYFATASGTFNVTTALRQPGSSIKPINYAIGIERKIVNPATVFIDAKTCFKADGQPEPYCPENYDGRFHGLVQLRFALGNSYNIPAVKMMALNGVENFIASSSSFLITSFKDPTQYGLSLTLGGGEVTMVEMAQAFSAFANEGIPKQLISVLKVQDKNNKVLYEYKDPNLSLDIKKPLNYPNFLAISGKRAISPRTSFIISHILLDNNARSAAFGSSNQLNVKGHKAVSVKTGTTNNKRDNLTYGYTPNFLVGVWVGNNDNTPMHPSLTSGVTGAAPIWNKVMAYILEDQPDLWPRKPDGVEGRQVCVDTGVLMSRTPEGSESCPSRFEYFVKGTEGLQSGINITREQIPVSRDTGKQTTTSDPSHEMQEKTIVKDGNSNYCVDCVHDEAPTPAQ